VRIIVLFGWARLILQNEVGRFRWRAIDTCVVLWAVSMTTVYTLQWQTSSAAINRLGASFDAMGGYFFFRSVFRTRADIERTCINIGLASLLVVSVFAVEKATGRNLFSFLGGVPEVTAERQGRLRCQGAFSHPILAGCFWAALLPLVASLWWIDRRHRTMVAFAVPSILGIVVFCASSTPLITVATAMAGGGLILVRPYLSWMRIGAVAMLILLHLVMNKPVWHLVARVNVVGGSTGWHRYKLIDSAINNFGEWAILGVRETGHWGYGMHDVTNQYVLEAVRGGLTTLIIFVTTICLAFSSVGRAMQDRLIPQDRQAVLAWAIGVCLACHCMSFIAVSYFGQSTMLWYLTLAMAAAIRDTGPAAVTAAARRRTSADDHRHQLQHA
jgi:hypothetical protein